MPASSFVDSVIAAYRTLFPGGCQACLKNKPESTVPHLCSDCLNNVAVPPANLCAVCGRPLEFGYEIETGQSYACGVCREKPPLYSRRRSALEYEGPARELIHKFKFQGGAYLARTLALLGKDSLVPWLAEWPEAVIVPVPLARRKLLARGYNPSFLLAGLFGRWAGLYVAEGCLRRIRNTVPQFGLKYDERRKNVRGAFEVHEPGVIKGRTVVLFDDIYTTGATIDECCRVVKKAKPAEILAAVLCRAGVE